MQVANNAATKPSGIEGMIGEASGLPSGVKVQNKFENIAGSTPTQGIASEAVFQETPKLNFGDGEDKEVSSIKSSLEEDNRYSPERRESIAYAIYASHHKKKHGYSI